MVFPIESEDRAERNLLMLFRENSRIIIDSFRKTLIYLDSLTKEELQKNSIQVTELHRISEDAIKNRNTLIKELNEVGGILHNRDDFFRLLTTFSDATDILNSLNIRLIEIKFRDWKLNKKEAEGLMKMSDLTFNAYLKIRDSLTSLGFNSEKAIGFAQEVDDLEQKLDVLYVQVDLDIITSGDDFALILVLRDVARETESLMNKARDCANLVRMLSV